MMREVDTFLGAYILPLFNDDEHKPLVSEDEILAAYCDYKNDITNNKDIEKYNATFIEKTKQKNKLSLDELCKIHGGICNIPLA